MLTKTLNAYPFTIRPIMEWENQTPICMEFSVLSRDGEIKLQFHGVLIPITR
jgi:hypothetical protein